MANFPNDGVGYNIHAELMAKRASRLEMPNNRLSTEEEILFDEMVKLQDKEHAAFAAGLNNNLCSNL